MLERKGVKLSKKNKALMSQMQGKFQNDLKVGNMEYGKFQRAMEEEYERLKGYEKELRAYRDRLRRRVDRLEWTVVGKAESYFGYLQREDEEV